MKHPQNNSSVWKWLVIAGGIVLIFACGACVMARMACDSAVNGALDALPDVSPSSPQAPAAGVSARPFTALASHLRFNHDHREGPGANLLEGYADEDSGVAVRVFRTSTSTRVAYLLTDRYLGDLSSAEREAMLREVATEFENSFPDTDFLIAYRGRLLFGASAIKVGATAWQFQTGASISEAPLHEFFSGLLPSPAFTPITNEALAIQGETKEGEGSEVNVDCAGNFTLLPQARLHLAAPYTGLSLRARGQEGISILSILLRRPDGVHRCVYAEEQDVVLEGAFPEGDYDVWVGGLGPSSTFELNIAATGAGLPTQDSVAQGSAAGFSDFVETLNELCPDTWCEGAFNFEFQRVTCEADECLIAFRAQHFAEGAPWLEDTIPVKRDDLQLEDGYPGERFFDAASEALIDWERENTPD
ncbi:MAG: hypothetical protein AB8H86_29620 [Polyangiales bacterium]